MLSGYIKTRNRPGGTWEAEAGGYLWAWSSLVYSSEFQDSQGHVERPCLKQTNKKGKKNNKIQGMERWLSGYEHFGLS